MGRSNARSASGLNRLSGAWDELKSSFGAPAGLAMLVGLGLGFGLPALDDLLDINIPTFSFGSQAAAEGLLETIATVTVAVAGLAFSVTVVAFTLTASQLSPRVLRSFRSDRLSQTVLALFLGTFIYCLAVLVRLGVREEGVPDLSITVAMLLALVSFLLFAIFIGHLARMLEASTVISTIVKEAKQELGHQFPTRIGKDPVPPEDAREKTVTRMDSSAAVDIEADGDGYLRLVEGEGVISAAKERDAVVRQSLPIGEYVTPGTVLAQAWARDLSHEDRDELVQGVRGAFVLGKERSLVQDVTFPIRQLSDVALKGLSPGINDPTTAENAMDAMTAVIIHFIRSERVDGVRVDDEGEPRFVADVPDLDDLVRLGFRQVRVFAAPYPVVSMRLLTLLGRIRDAAQATGLDHAEVDRQDALLREGPEGEVPTAADASAVRYAHRQIDG